MVSDGQRFIAYGQRFIAVWRLGTTIVVAFWMGNDKVGNPRTSRNETVTLYLSLFLFLTLALLLRTHKPLLISAKPDWKGLASLRKQPSFFAPRPEWRFARRTSAIYRRKFHTDDVSVKFIILHKYRTNGPHALAKKPPTMDETNHRYMPPYLFWWEFQCFAYLRA